MIRPLSTVACAIALLAPAAASAATTVDGTDDTVFVEGDANANAITVSQEAEHVVISEAGAIVQDADAGDDCEQDGARVRCTTLGALEYVRVRGGEGADTLVDDLAAGHPLTRVTLQGLAGNDTLRSSSNGAATEMQGGEGNDALEARAGYLGTGDEGGPGDDTFRGSDPHADVFRQEPGADVYVGGTRAHVPACGDVCEDYDQIAYLTGPVTVTLDGAGGDGAAGEADNVHGDIETVTGTAGNDRLDVAGAAGRHVLSGDAGDDALTGGAGRDELDGGDGADTLSGLGGDDRLRSGDDEQAAPAPDRLDGGAGDDQLTPGYGAEDLIGGPGIDATDLFRSGAGDAPVGFEVTLDDQANDGARGAAEGDNVHADVEVVRTWAGDDRIVGAAGAEQLDGGPGNDEIDGRGGVDLLTGGSGADTLLARDGGFDLVNCGEGADPPAQADEGDRLEGCEAAMLATLPAPPDTVRPQLTLRAATVITARAFARARGVTVTARTNETSSLFGEAVVRGMIARAGDLVIGERKLPLAKAGTRKFKIRFSRRDVRAIQRKLRRRAFRMTVRVTATDAAGNRTTASRRVTIRRR